MVDFAPLIAAVPLVVIERTPIGRFAVRTWRAPLTGWEPISDAQHFASVQEAASEQSLRVMLEGGATVSLHLEPLLFRMGGAHG